MYERRRQAASLVSLLVVTSLFVWACSSGGHEDASVTTSGGSGSEVAIGGARSSQAESGSDSAFGGALELGAASAMNDGGSAAESLEPKPEPSEAGAPQVSNGGAGSLGGSPPSTGGTADMSRAGAPDVDSGDSGAFGSGASDSGAGAPAVDDPPDPVDPVEPVCDPANDHSTPAMLLPCEVSTALYVCRTCHSNTPAKGVFTTYMTYADIKASAPKIYGVIKSGTMPWPPYKLSNWQRTTILKWLGKNGTCAIGAATSCQ